MGELADQLAGMRVRLDNMGAEHASADRRLQDQEAVLGSINQDMEIHISLCQGLAKGYCSTASATLCCRESPPCLPGKHSWQYTVTQLAQHPSRVPMRGPCMEARRLTQGRRQAGPGFQPQLGQGAAQGSNGMVCLPTKPSMPLTFIQNKA